MSASVATQTTTFLPAIPPVLQDRKLSKRFFARMKRLLSRDLNKGKKIAKEQQTVNTEIRYIMTHMGIIANDNQKYYKNLAKNKLKRTKGKKIAEKAELETVPAIKEEKAAKKAEQLAIKEEKAAKKAELERRIAEKAELERRIAEKAELERRIAEEADEETYEDYIEDNYGSDVEVDEPVY